MVLCCTSLSRGQSAEPSEPRKSTSSLSGQLELPRLLDLCSDRLKVTIDYDPASVKGSITLRLPTGLSDQELWDLTNRLLAARGLTTVRMPGNNLFGVVKIADAAAVSKVSVPPATASPSTPGEANAPGNAAGVVNPEAPAGVPGVGNAAGAGNQPGGNGAAGGQSTPPEIAAGFQSVLVRLKYRTSKDIADAVRTVLSKPGGTAQELGDEGLLLISDLAPRIEQAQQIIDLLDTPKNDAVVVEVPVANVTVAQLVASATQVMTERDAVSGRKGSGKVVASPSGNSVLIVAPPARLDDWKDSLTRLDKREPTERRIYSSRRFAPSDVAKLIESSLGSTNAPGQDSSTMRVVVDDLTGSLIVTASPSEHEQIQALVDRLDSTEQTAAPMRTFVIRNRPVAEVVETLSNLISAGALQAGGTEEDRANVSAGASQFKARDVVVGSAGAGTPLLPTNPTAAPAGVTLKSSGGAGPSTSHGSAQGSNQAPVKLTADKATNTLIAVGEPRFLSQLEKLLAIIDVRQPQVMLEVMLVSLSDTESQELGIEVEKLGGIGDARFRLSSLFGLSTGPAATRSVGDGLGFTGAVLNPGEFSVIVRALEQLSKSKTQSNPKLLVTNNERAVFSSTLQQPVSVRTESANSTATTTFGGSDSAGTTISVQPQIAPGDHLVLTYSIKLSSFQGGGSAGLPPPKQENSVDSVATIPDGYTVVVGGLESLSNSDGETRLPIIGQIPLLGDLFKDQTSSNSHTRFFVFIKATVLRSGSFDDLKYISSADAKTAAVNDGAPEVAPRIIR